MDKQIGRNRALSGTDPEGIITGGHESWTGRTVAVHDGEKTNAPVLLAIFEQIISNNIAGGRRKIKRES
ncbi:hypothetical protein ACQPZ2_36150 [Nocardia pseudovaccinii]|uniref:hypothetical protein n=1 Tax=Nocardia pseudovaccinii TaxID=189540 RepID=UPI003D8E53FA